MPPKRTILFDLYGTLVDFLPDDYANVLAKLARRLSIPAPAFTEAWLADWSLLEIGHIETVAEYIEHVCCKVGTSPAEGAVSQAEEAHYRYQAGLLSPRPETLQLLEGLRNHGIGLAIISNCPPETVELWDSCPLSPYFSVAVLSPVVKLRKPDRRIFEVALDELQAEPSEALMVGDSWEADVLGAYRAGIKPLWLNVAQKPSQDPQLANEISSLHCLVEHLT